MCGDEHMKKKINKKLAGALAICMLIAAAWVVLASELTTATENNNGDIENGSDTSANNFGENFYNRVRQRWQERMGKFAGGNHGMQGRIGQQKAGIQERIWHNIGSNYLNITRLEGILGYENGTYIVATTALYLGNEWFLDSLAKSDYDGDGTYEYIWQELEGLLGVSIIANGVLEDEVLYASHINGIYLRAPNQADISELEGLLEYSNGSYFVEGTELAVKLRGYSKSDIDGDGTLERMIGELDGLVGEEITADGTLTDDERLFVAHINGIWIL
jgi:hypothetical protein